MATSARTPLLATAALVLLVQVVVSQQHAASSKSMKFARSGDGSGVVYSASLLWAFNARSLLSCTKACAADDLCVSFTFHKGRGRGGDLWKTCRGHSKPGGLLTAETAVAGVVLFTLQGAGVPTCGDPPFVLNANASLTSGQHEDRAHYTCNSGFVNWNAAVLPNSPPSGAVDGTSVADQNAFIYTGSGSNQGSGSSTDGSGSDYYGRSYFGVGFRQTLDGTYYGGSYGDFYFGSGESVDYSNDYDNAWNYTGPTSPSATGVPAVSGGATGSPYNDSSNSDGPGPSGNSCSTGNASETCVDEGPGFGWRFCDGSGAWQLMSGQSDPVCRHYGCLCNTSTECWADSNFRCVSGHCQCSPGFFYSEFYDTCEASCSFLSYNFIDYPQTALPVAAVETVDNITLFHCFNRCLSATDYTCTTLSFNFDNGTCLLNSEMASGTVQLFEIDSASRKETHFQRTCD